MIHVASLQGRGAHDAGHHDSVSCGQGSTWPASRWPGHDRFCHRRLVAPVCRLQPSRAGHGGQRQPRSGPDRGGGAQRAAQGVHIVQGVEELARVEAILQRLALIVGHRSRARILASMIMAE